jgi:hypothetical protein
MVYLRKLKYRWPQFQLCRSIYLEQYTVQTNKMRIRVVLFQVVDNEETALDSLMLIFKRINSICKLCIFYTDNAKNFLA